MKLPKMKLPTMKLPIVKVFKDRIETFENDLIERIMRLPPEERAKILYGAYNRFNTKKRPTSSKED